MKTTTITIKEYAILYGCTPRCINFKANAGELLTGMIGYRKSEGTWLVDVLVSWYEGKKRERTTKI